MKAILIHKQLTTNNIGILKKIDREGIQHIIIHRNIHCSDICLVDSVEG